MVGNCSLDFCLCVFQRSKRITINKRRNRRRGPQPTHQYKLRKRGRTHIRAKWMKIYDYLDRPDACIESDKTYFRWAQGAEIEHNYRRYLDYWRYKRRAIF